MAGLDAATDRNPATRCIRRCCSGVFSPVTAMRFLASLAAGLCLGLPLRAGVLDWLFPKRDVEVIAVTDTTPVGALRRPASLANPVYYIAVSAGYRDFGGIVAGDKIPPKEKVHTTMARVLAKQGYLPSSAQHPPAVLLLWTWGTLNTDLYPSMNPDLPDRQVNRSQLLRFMGAYKLGMIPREPGVLQGEMFPGVLFHDADQQQLSELAAEDLYVIALAAYDYGAAARREKVLLWTTKISCPSRGLAMDATMPAMLALAAPYIGRETAKPVSLRATEQFKTDVKIGDPQVVEYLESTPIPVAEPPPAPKGGKAAPAKTGAPKKQR